MYNLYILLCIITIIHEIFGFIPGVHQCEQGHLCAYKRGGAILDYTGEPGYHLHIPFITKVYNVKTTWQTDSLTDVVCGSNKGSNAYLDIDVVNKLKHDNYCVTHIISNYGVDYDSSLIYNYVPTEVAQFCKQFTIDEIKVEKYDKLDEILLEKLKKNIDGYGLSDCIEIKKVRIYSPKLDEKMTIKFQAIELEEKDKELAIKKKETEKVQQEALLQKEKMDMERDQEKKRIDSETKKKQVIAQAERQSILDEMEFLKIKKLADSELYRLKLLAEGNKYLYSNENYIKVKGFEAAHSNSKLIFGDVPQNALFGLGMKFENTDKN